MKKLRTLMIIVGWFAAAFALLYVMLRLDCLWNFFDWSPKWDAASALDGVGILAVLVCIFFLARAARDRGSQVVSALICFLLVVFALYFVLPAEPLTGGFLGRTRPSPLWFRAGFCAVLSLPGIIWLWNAWHRHHSAHALDLNHPQARI